MPDAQPYAPGSLHARRKGSLASTWRGTQALANFIDGPVRWRGHLFEGHFASVAIDEGRLISAVRHVAHNPAHACLVVRAQDWKRQ